MVLKRFFAPKMSPGSDSPPLSLAIRAEELKPEALALINSVQMDAADGLEEQNAHLRLIQMAPLEPRQAVRDGWTEVAKLLAKVSASHKLKPHRGNTLRLLNSMEKAKLLNFDSYALLREMNQFQQDAGRMTDGDITSAAAHDYCIVVRAAQRLLSGMLSQPQRAPMACFADANITLGVTSQSFDHHREAHRE